jgi:outer membrane murein-binding lipoprotein Lpp
MRKSGRGPARPSPDQFQGTRATCGDLNPGSPPSNGETKMNLKYLKGLALGVAVLGSLSLGACASTEDLNALKADVAQAKSDAAQAKADAAAAKQQAAAAQQTAQAASEKADRIYQRSQRK